MTSLRIATLFGLAMLTILAAVPSARAQNTVGTITQLQGTANIQRNGATIAAAPNLPILLHDRIATDPSGSRGKDSVSAGRSSSSSGKAKQASTTW